MTQDWVICYTTYIAEFPKSKTILNDWNCYAHNRICNKKEVVIIKKKKKKMQNRHICLMISDFWSSLKDAGSLFYEIPMFLSTEMGILK